MNRYEKIVKQHLKDRGFKNIRRIDKVDGSPDFIVDNKFYIEVKNKDHYHTSFLNSLQEHKFASLKLPIFICFVRKNKVIGFQRYYLMKDLPNLTRYLKVSFDDDIFEELQKIKGNLTWREFILKKAGINLGKNGEGA